MGSGIAQVSAAAGLQVVLVDRDQETADKGKAALHKSLSDRVMKGRMKGAERDTLLEISVRDTLAQELPIESDRQRWLAVWDAPGL